MAAAPSFSVPPRNSVIVIASSSPRTRASPSVAQANSGSSGPLASQNSERAVRDGGDPGRRGGGPAATPHTLRRRPSRQECTHIVAVAEDKRQRGEHPRPRTKSRCRVESAVRASLSQRCSAITGEPQPAGLSVRQYLGCAERSKHFLEDRSAGACRSVNRSANPWRRRSDGPGGCGAVGWRAPPH
jgi:hypothetical protein